MRAVLVKIKSGRHDGLLGLYGRICNGCSPEDAIERSPKHERIDPEVNFIWIDDPLPGVPLESFVAIWSGYIYIPKSGSYRFFIDADDGARLYIDDRIIIDRWINTELRIAFSDPLELSQGPHRVRLEYYNQGPFGKIRLGWSFREGHLEIISSRYLYTTPSRSIIITGIPKTYRVVVAIDGEIREAVFRGGIAMIPLGSRENSSEGIIKVFDENGDPVYMSPYIEIWPGDIYSLEAIE